MGSSNMEVTVVFNSTDNYLDNFDNSNAFMYGAPAVPPFVPAAAAYTNTLIAPPAASEFSLRQTAGFSAPFFDTVLDGSNGQSLSAPTFVTAIQPPTVPVGVVYLREPKILVPNIDTTTAVATFGLGIGESSTSTRNSSLDELSSLLRPPPYVNQEMLSIILICAGIAAGILFILALLLCRFCANRRERERVRKRLRMEGFLPTPKSSLLPGQFPTGAAVVPVIFNDGYGEKPGYMLTSGMSEDKIPASDEMREVAAASPLPMSFPLGALTVPAAAETEKTMRDDDTESSQISTAPQPQASAEARPNMLLYAPVATVQIPPTIQRPVRSASSQRVYEYSASQNNENQMASTRLYQHPTEGISYLQSPMPTAKIVFNEGKNNDAEAVRTTTIHIQQNGPFKWQAVETPVLSSSSPAGVANKAFDAVNLLKIALYSPANTTQGIFGGELRRSHHYHHRSGSRHKSRSRSRSQDGRRNNGSADGEVATGLTRQNYLSGNESKLVQSRTHPEFLFQANRSRDDEAAGYKRGVGKPVFREQQYAKDWYKDFPEYRSGSTLREVKQARKILRETTTAASAVDNVPYSNFRLSRHTEV